MDGWLKKISLICVLALTTNINAAELHESYNGIRGLSMGGAAIAVVNDETALLVNPAALGKLRDYFVTVVDPEIAVSDNNQPQFNTDLLATLSPQSTMDTLKNAVGTHAHSRAQVFPSLVLPNFGIGFIGSMRADAEVLTGGTEFLYEYQNDYGFIMGFNFRLFDGKIKFGFSGKIINRVHISENALDTSRTDLSLSTLSTEGLGIGADAGLILTGPWKLLPTLAILGRDIGNTRYDFSDGLFSTTAIKPPSDAQKIDVALAIFPIVGKRTRTSITLEARDVTTLSDETDSMKRYHAGFEFNFYDALFLRGGYNQRYWTAGVELAVKNYQLQLASYGEEIGTAAINKEDRRYVIKFAYRF